VNDVLPHQAIQPPRDGIGVHVQSACQHCPGYFKIRNAPYQVIQLAEKHDGRCCQLWQFPDVPVHG